MFKTVTPPRRGAPDQHPADVLKTKLWVWVLKLISGLKTAYALELEIDPELVKQRTAGVVRPRKWDAYEKGLKVPKRIKGKRYSVDMAEAKFPGAKRYFDSPMWKVLRGQKLTAREVDQALRTLEGAVLEVLLEESVREGEQERRFRSFDVNTAKALAAVGTFDSLAATILLVAKSEAIGSVELRELALQCYLVLQGAISQLPEVQPWSSELFRMIDLTCKHWIFPFPNARMEIVIFTENLKDLPPLDEPS